MEQRQRVTGSWSSHEDAILIREYAAGGRWQDHVERILGRTPKAARHRIELLRKRGILTQRNPMPRLKVGRGLPFSPREIAEIRGMAQQGASLREIAARLHRSETTIKSKLRSTGIRLLGHKETPSGEIVFERKGAWSEEELIQLRARLASGCLQTEIAREFGRDYGSVKQKVAALGLRTGPLPWREDDDMRLRLLFHAGLSDQEIGRRLDRTRRAIAHRRADLALVRATALPWTDKEIAELRRHYDAGLSDVEIASKIGRSPRAIQNHREQLHLSRPRTGRPKRIRQSSPAA